MEYFVNDPRVLSSFARHHQTGEPISESMLQELRKSNAVGVAFETQTQVCECVLVKFNIMVCVWVVLVSDLVLQCYTSSVKVVSMLTLMCAIFYFQCSYF